jgi:cytochrome P450 family 135
MDGPPTGRLPPGPRLPRWLQTAGFLLQPARWIDANRRRYGDMVTFRTLFDPCFVMVFDPELVKQVFRGKPDQLRAGEANAVQPPSPSSAHQVEPDDFDGRTRA